MIIDNFIFHPQTRNQVENRGEQLDLILWQGKQWAVTEYGIEKRDGTYTILAMHAWSFTPASKGRRKTKQDVMRHWLEHLSLKSWCDTDDIEAALHAFLLLFNEDGSRTQVLPPLLMGMAEIEEYASNCANAEYEAARQRALYGVKK